MTDVNSRGGTSTQTLRERISGEVVLPSDETYEQHRNAFMYPGSPAVIARCRTHDDIRHALQFGREQQLPISIRSGGHGPGFGTNDGGLVIDLSPFDQVEILDDQRRLVRIGTGARWIDVANALGPHGLAISSGDTTKVGVGGLILGGGMGWLVRKCGLTIDSLVAADVVTADGRTLRASADEHPDLFWAIRGGGGNFGVVTAFELVATPVRNVLAGTITYPPSDAPSVLKKWRDYMREAPEDLTTTAMLMPEMPEGPPPFAIGVCCPADDESAARAAVDPLLGLDDGAAHDLKTMPYGDVLEEPHELPPGMGPPLGKNDLVSELHDEVIDLVVRRVRESGATMAQLRSLGGALSRIPSEATAFAQRDSEALVMTVTFDRSPEGVAAYDAMRESLASFSSGSYGNLTNTRDADDPRAIYPPSTYERLAAVKRAYDPENLFNQNYNIRPA
ncbi:MAG: FAD-binding protein [Propionibacteriales bacterium]|nr:FAD-binding protein [Propionibacteriales bacterium]